MLSSAAGYAAVPEARHSVRPGQTASLPIALHASDGWHDIVVRVEGQPGFLRRFAGAYGNSRTDPGISAMRTSPGH